MIAFELVHHHGRATWAHAILLITFLVLLAAPALAISIGDCFNDSFCGDRTMITSSVEGDLLPNDEYNIKGPCPAFLSFVGQPDKVDVCTDTKCSRLEKFRCYSDKKGYKTVEVLE